MNGNKIIQEWYSLYADDIYNFLIYYSSNTDAEDILQEVFIKALNNLENFEWNSNPKTWLIKIARNTAIDQSRRLSRLQLILKKIRKKDEYVSPEDIFIENEEIAELYCHINKLPQKYREVVILRGILELSVTGTATVTGWTENSIRLNYHRAKKKLKDSYFERSVLRDESV
ncbi:sigma-70 family RNA polymerase sigma factor [Bacillus sp. ISL-47]|uniref:RNA polymerase sigma factor n=1 Tax=Bacillus sp. ISL-47 TaxID=2819130 RepID=UPI001BE8EDB6|nr:sigma-70 family RNA polymerase sigma factor [Bacillus sp. ISL-47]MBT2687782.1 sigma-70 family RNA polymerase sigma factor [Bacillus sp. ISL-47]MBT2709124.1 sigma-70 family RNA polymerase sigma factor [Pseudomonas sp. ISL-84]